MSASASGIFGGTPSTTTPIAGPWLSPQVVKRNSVPKLLPAIADRVSRAAGCGCWPAGARPARRVPRSSRSGSRAVRWRSSRTRGRACPPRPRWLPSTVRTSPGRRSRDRLSRPATPRSAFDIDIVLVGISSTDRPERRIDLAATAVALDKDHFGHRTARVTARSDAAPGLRRGSRRRRPWVFGIGGRRHNVEQHRGRSVGGRPSRSTIAGGVGPRKCHDRVRCRLGRRPLGAQRLLTGAANRRRRPRDPEPRDRGRNLLDRSGSPVAADRERDFGIGAVSSMPIATRRIGFGQATRPALRFEKFHLLIPRAASNCRPRPENRREWRRVSGHRISNLKRGSSRRSHSGPLVRVTETQSRIAASPRRNPSRCR